MSHARAQVRKMFLDVVPSCVIASHMLSIPPFMSQEFPKSLRHTSV